VSIQVDDVTSGKVRIGRQPVGDRTVTFLPEPERRPRRYTIISVDDHVVEPADAFEGRVPKTLAERAPRIERGDDGSEAWVYDGNVMPQIGFSAVVGRPTSEYTNEPTRYDEMRRGAWDVHARVKDMDLDGVYASLNFPSFLPGFGGGRIQTVTRDLELALATVRAWNSWHLEAWCGAYPDRFIACQIPWLHDPALSAAEIVRNAELGFRAVSFPESPEKRGFPSIHSQHWDPIMTACQETQTVLCLHTGSGGSIPSTAPDAPMEVMSTLFGIYAMMPAADWLFSLIPVRFPELRIAMSEGGIGWVAGMLDRLEHIIAYQDAYGGWVGTELTPAEVFKRSFWFCALDNPSSFCQLDRIGVDHVMCEVDYPHPDTTWPNSQALLRRHLTSLDEDVAQAVTWRNAATLFRHPVPEAVQRDPDAF
jgi:predicted TIM-barrel fold metal-dependent hydrolase